MDLSTIGPLLIGALGALAALGQYLRKQARADRAENRKLRRLVVAYDAHCFKLERGWSRIGRRPPQRPAILMEAEHGEDDDVPEDPEPPLGDVLAAGPDDAGPGPDPGRRRRHRAEG